MNTELIEKELAFLGIIIKDNNINYYSNGEVIAIPNTEIVNKINSNIKNNDQFLTSIWEEMINSFVDIEKGIAGNETTQRLFINTIKNFYNLCKNSKKLIKSSRIFKHILRHDINDFNEEFMSKIIDYGISINWLKRCILKDLYKIELLKLVLPEVKIANTGGYMGFLDIPMEDRAREYKDIEEENEDTKNSPNYWFWKHRHDLPETYNKPNEFETGFYYDHESSRMPFQKQEDSPYPHSTVNTVDQRDRADSERNYPLKSNFPISKKVKESPKKFNISDFKESKK